MQRGDVFKRIHRAAGCYIAPCRDPSLAHTQAMVMRRAEQRQRRRGRLARGADHPLAPRRGKTSKVRRMHLVLRAWIAFKNFIFAKRHRALRREGQRSGRK